MDRFPRGSNSQKSALTRQSGWLADYNPAADLYKKCVDIPGRSSIVASSKGITPLMNQPEPGCKIRQDRMKTQIVSTPAGFIVKVPTELAQYDRAVKRAEKKLGGDLHFIGHSGDYTVLALRGSAALGLHSKRMVSRRDHRSQINTRFDGFSRSVAAKRFDKINVARGESKGGGNWHPRNQVERNLCHVACNGRICVVPNFTPKLP